MVYFLCTIDIAYRNLCFRATDISQSLYKKIHDHAEDFHSAAASKGIPIYSYFIYCPPFFFVSFLFLRALISLVLKGRN